MGNIPEMYSSEGARQKTRIQAREIQTSKESVDETRMRGRGYRVQR